MLAAMFSGRHTVCEDPEKVDRSFEISFQILITCLHMKVSLIVADRKRIIAHSLQA
jgi:hypothetical protein